MKAIADFFRGATALTVAAFAVAISFTSVQAQDATLKDATLKDAASKDAASKDALKPNCTAPSELTRLDYPLKRVSQKVSAGQPIKIVAIGSSSTAGAGASSPAMSYPSRLQVEL